MREKLRAKHRERQENEVAKRTVVMCARLRRSLPCVKPAGQRNIAALVGRWIDGHSRFCWCPFFYAQNQVQKGGQAGSPVPWQAALETGSGPNPGRPFYSFYSTINCEEFPVSSGDSPRFCCAQNRWDPPWFHWGEPIRPHQRQALHPRFAFAGGVCGKLSATPRSARRCRKTARRCSSSAPGWRPCWPPNPRRPITTQKARPVPNGTGLALLGVCTRQGVGIRPDRSNPRPGCPGCRCGRWWPL